MQRFLPLLLVFSAGQLSAQSINWVTACTNLTACLNPGSCTQGHVFAVERAVTSCANPTIIYSYKVDLGNNGSIDMQSNKDTLDIDLPVGTHGIIWKANDFCGNQSVNCGYLVTVRDCNPPNLVCRNGLTQNLELPDCAATFNASDFILNLSDNCTPVNQIKRAMRVAGTGTGFPSDTTLSFGICEKGLHILEIWVKDGNNLTNQCNNYVLVQENNGVCECNIDANLSLTGCVQSADSAKLTNYTVSSVLQGTPLQGQPISKVLNKSVTDSCFTVTYQALPLNGMYNGVVRASRPDDPLTGVSTFDLVLINKHILGQQPLENFYQAFAADVNQSKTITTFDIIEIRKLILGVYDSFPATPPWRFVRPIPDPTNLLAFDAVRDTYQFAVPNLVDDLTLKGFNFVAVKMGDANSNAALTGGKAEDRDSGPPLLLTTGAVLLNPGDTYRIPLQPAEKVDLDGWQIALRLDPDALEIQDIQGVAPEFVSLSPDGVIRISAVNNQPIAYGPDNPLGYVLVRAKRAVQLADAISPELTHLRSEAYRMGAAQVIRPIVFRVGDRAPDVVFFPPQPNPFLEETTISLLLNERNTVELEVFDEAGHRVFQTNSMREAGYQTLTIPARSLPAPGVWMYRIRAGSALSSGRIVRL